MTAYAEDIVANVSQANESITTLKHTIEQKPGAPEQVQAVMEQLRGFSRTLDLHFCEQLRKTQEDLQEGITYIIYDTDDVPLDFILTVLTGDPFTSETYLQFQQIGPCRTFIHRVTGRIFRAIPWDDWAQRDAAALRALGVKNLDLWGTAMQLYQIASWFRAGIQDRIQGSGPVWDDTGHKTLANYIESVIAGHDLQIAPWIRGAFLCYSEILRQVQSIHH